MVVPQKRFVKLRFALFPLCTKSLYGFLTLLCCFNYRFEYRRYSGGTS